jgi:histone H3/H4
MGMVVKSAVRDSVKKNYNVSEEFLKALDMEVARLVKRAGERANKNGRKTLKARDV